MASSSYSYKQGDWACGKCGFVNFAKKTECSKCRTGKSETTTAMKPGDWICSSCHDLNFASRTTCRKCNNAKSASNGNKRIRLSESHPSVSNAPPAFKQGDWKCPSCSEHNFASRNTCRKCSASKDAQPHQNADLNNSSNSSSSDSGECVVCMEKKADHVVTVCGHLVLCAQCNKSVDKCPMCRKPFTREQIIKVFSG